MHIAVTKSRELNKIHNQEYGDLYSTSIVHSEFLSHVSHET